MNCVLLHGLGQSPADWKDTINNIDKSTAVFCPSLFDWLHGTVYCYGNLYKSLENYCSQFEEPFVLGGLSLGGILALQYAIEHSDKVDALILMGTQYSMPERMLKFQNIIFRFLPDRAFREMGASKKEIISLCRSMIDLDFTDRLKDIRSRTLILCGGKDRANYAASIKLKERIPNAELSVMPDAGHEINKDCPQKLGEKINAFLL